MECHSKTTFLSPAWGAVPSCFVLASTNIRCRMTLKRFVRAWLALQVSHRGGTYSVERVLALGEFTTKTSLFSVLLVCSSTPLPMIALALCQEFVPLQEPLDGWLANYGFWIRLFIMCGVISNAITLQAKFLVDGMRISLQQLVLISVCGAVGGITVPLLVAALVSFPIPFTVVTMCPPFFILLATSFRVVMGTEGFREILLHREQIWRLVAFVCSQVVLVVVYPVYQTLFEAAAHTKWQLLVVLLLPLLKLAMKYLVTLTVAHVEDMMPELVIVTVDFFNALYLATSMQSATSTTTVVAIMALDLSQTAVGLFALNKRTASILSRLHEALAVPEHERASLNLLSSICLLCRSPERFKPLAAAGVRVRSPLQHRLTSESRDLLDCLDQLKLDGLHSKISSRRTISLKAIATIPPDGRSTTTRGFRKILCKYVDRSTVSPNINCQLTSVSSIPVLDGKNRVVNDLGQTQELLREALAVLFTSECLVLTEFLESIIPMFYGIYVLVMVRLPSAQYHIELVNVTRENVVPTVLTVFVYALLEFASFVVLAIIMERNCGMRALSHLAFVLHTQMQLVQSKMALWMVVTLAFRVVHFGAHKTADIPSADDLRRQWAWTRLAVADFNKVHSELHAAATCLRPSIRWEGYKMLQKRARAQFWAKIGFRFEFVWTWRILMRHSKWLSTLKVQVLDEEVGSAPGLRREFPRPGSPQPAPTPMPLTQRDDAPPNGDDLEQNEEEEVVGRPAILPAVARAKRSRPAGSPFYFKDEEETTYTEAAPSVVGSSRSKRARRDDEVRSGAPASVTGTEASPLYRGSSSSSSGGSQQPGLSSSQSAMANDEVHAETSSMEQPGRENRSSDTLPAATRVKTEIPDRPECQFGGYEPPIYPQEGPAVVDTDRGDQETRKMDPEPEVSVPVSQESKQFVRSKTSISRL